MVLRILHAHSTFALGGKEARAVRLMNAFGDSADHVILSAVPGALSARAAIARGISADFPTDAPLLAGRPSLVRLFHLARYMRRFDLVLSYNWGGFDAVMARRLFGGPPLVHHEDGFNQDEVARLNPRRNLYRRIGLPAAFRLVVPSERLERIALREWRQPRERLVRIANGVNLAAFASRSVEDSSIPGLARGTGEVVIGTFAGLRPVKNLPRLIRAFAAMQMKKARLVIVGEGPDSERIAAEARRCGVADRLVMPGFIGDPPRVMRAFDIFALSSDSEQFPISLVEAMAAGLPVAAPAVGDIAAMVSPDNGPLIVGPDDEAALAAALDTLAEREDLRASIGLANRKKAAADFDEKQMISRYARLYGEATGASQLFLNACT